MRPDAKPLHERWPEAAARADRMLLALYDADGPLTVREAIDSMSDYMSRDDAESALIRLRGGGSVKVADTAEHPYRYEPTLAGRRWAEAAILRGASY